jgi:mannose-1-phosphate guanylyltransferase
MAELHALILAGGASSRFWPLAGDDHPKYLLKVGGRTLLDHAWQRALACTDAARIHVVTAAPQARHIREALPDLQPANLCVEPDRKDTAAAVALGCKHIAAVDPDARVLVLPADTLLEPENALADGVRSAAVAPGCDDAIHVFGVKPARAEGSFGYITLGAELAPGVHTAEGFKEKPGVDRAAEFVRQGMLWNVGCFLFTLAAFDRELAAHMPGHSSRLRPATPGAVTRADYTGLESISIDFGLIEKVRDLRVVRLEATFDDLGSWDALLPRLPESETRAVSVAGANNRAIGGAEVAVVGASDLLVVVEGNRVLVMKQGHGQEVKQAAQPKVPNPKSKIQNPTFLRWLGVDFGRKWVGVAVGEPGGVCMPLKTLDARPEDKLLSALKRLAREHGAEAMVVGLPLNMNGSEGHAAKVCRDFAARLGAHTGLPVQLFDERLSSWDAEGRLIDAGLKPSERKQRVHAVAAQMILEGYMKRLEGESAGA